MSKSNSKRYEAMVEYSRKQGEKTLQAVLDAIDTAQAEGDLSTVHVLELAGIKSRTYFTNHPDARLALESARKVHNNRLKKTKQNTNSREAIIKALQAQIKIKDKEIKDLKTELDSQGDYKTKYENALLEIVELKKQRDNAMKMSGLLDF